MFDWVLNMPLHPPPRNFVYTFRERLFPKKKKRELRNEFLQMFGETSLNKLLLLPKKVYIIFLNKKIKQ